MFYMYIIIFHIYAHNLLLWAVPGSREERKGIEYFIYIRGILYIYITDHNRTDAKNSPINHVAHSKNITAIQLS